MKLRRTKSVSVFWATLYLIFDYSDSNPNQWRRNEFERGGGHRFDAKRWKNFFGRAPLLFGSKSTSSRFRDGQYSLVSFLYAVLLPTVPPCPAFVKVGGTYPP